MLLLRRSVSRPLPGLPRPAPVELIVKRRIDLGRQLPGVLIPVALDPLSPQMIL